MRIRSIALIALSTALAAPAAAAPSTFWTFGFYFPNKAEHRSGGFASLGREAVRRPAEVVIPKMIPANMSANLATANLPYADTVTTSLW